MSTQVAFPSDLAELGPVAAEPGRRRLRLWELGHGFHCSIVGTCLSPGTARQIVRRARLEFEPDAQDYRLHSILVSEAARPSAVARLITRVLDDSFAGALRRVGARSGKADLRALWDAMCEKGEIAAAYWAFMTHAHIPAELRVQIFGEVHMLSHFMGGHNRAQAKELWFAERRVAQLGERLARSRRQNEATRAERDRRIAELESELTRTRLELVRRLARPVTARASRPERPRRDPGRLERRVLAARARLRQAEAENERLRRLLDLLAEGGGVPSVRIVPAPPAVGGGDEPPARCLLYVGGHGGLVPHLRRHAAARRIELLHHDGGMEHSLHVLEGLVGRADAVFCPIDCVSHQACLAAKQLCRRHDKPFVPLRTSSGSSLLRAIDRWRAAPGAAPVAQRAGRG